MRKELQQGAACVSAWYVPTTSIALLPELLLLVVNAVPFYWLAGIADDAAAFALTLLSQVSLEGSAEIGRDQPRSAEIGRDQPRSAKISRDRPRSAEISRILSSTKEVR